MASTWPPNSPDPNSIEHHCDAPEQVHSRASMNWIWLLTFKASAHGLWECPEVSGTRVLAVGPLSPVGGLWGGAFIALACSMDRYEIWGIWRPGWYLEFVTLLGPFLSSPEQVYTSTLLKYPLGIMNICNKFHPDTQLLRYSDPPDQPTDWNWHLKSYAASMAKNI